MRIHLFILLSLIALNMNAKDHIHQNPNKVIFGVGAGIGGLRLNTNNHIETTFSWTIPNIKLGYMISKKAAIVTLLPGSNYSYNKKDRGFEGLILATQYWPTQQWWILGGIGLTFDAPAFYTVKDPKTAGFYTGFPALTFGTGYEILNRKKHSIDLQYRFYYGQSNLPDNGFRKGISSMLILGYNLL